MRRQVPLITLYSRLERTESSSQHLSQITLVCEVVDFKSKTPKSYEDLSIISNVSFFLVGKKTKQNKNITNIKHVTNINQFSSLVFPKYEHRLINTKNVLLRIRSRWLCEEEMTRSWSSF